MKPALLLVDLQLDFLSRPGLAPDAAELVSCVEALLTGCRSLGLPILHAQTRVRADGSDRMPHWVRAGYSACVAGTAGALPPPGLAPQADEPIFAKRFFSAFEDPGLEQHLNTLGIDTLVIAGLYLHGCVRASVLDAYTAGFRVLVATDAVGSTEPLHATITREYLDGRAATFMRSDALLAQLAGTHAAATASAIEIACIGNRWTTATGRRALVFHPPVDVGAPETRIAAAQAADVGPATAAAVDAWATWRHTDQTTRVALLRRWRAILEQDSAALAALLAVEIGKPLAAGREEMQRALAHIDTAVRIASESPASPAGVRVRYRPVGCIGLITPWNNPVAIAVGKIAPALAFGNTVVWKPAPRAACTSRRVMESLIAAGVPPSVVTLVFGDADTAQALIREPAIAAVSVTGSQRTGQDAASLCALLGKPLQAELGGNNALIVLADADFEGAAAALARSAFGFAGQRCTAVRRFIVEAAIAAGFERALASATRALRIGDPCRDDTDMGPLISRERRAQVAAVVEQALASGGRLITGGVEPHGRSGGCWFEPTLLADIDPNAVIAQHETFGPVALVQRAAGLDDAVRLANGVPQGLLAGLLSPDVAAQARFAAGIDAGILQFGPGPFAIHADAPFGGWKSSRIGPAEHGRWDREFYAKPQVLYGESDGP